MKLTSREKEAANVQRGLANPYRIVRGLSEIASVFSVPPQVILAWIDQYGFPAAKLDCAGVDDWFAVLVDMVRWMRVWRVGSWMDATMQKMPPKELRRRLMQMREREREADAERTRARQRTARKAQEPADKIRI